MAEPAEVLETDDAESPAVDDGQFEIALDQFQTICTTEQEERANALQDRRFAIIAGAQWEGDWEAAFENSIMVEVNKLARGTDKIIDDYRANRMTVEFRPVSTKNPVDKETAETLNGQFLADVYASKGQQAFDGAFEEAVHGGMGAWRLCNRYVDEYDPDDDSQRIAFEWIPDADQAVFFDPNAKLYDKSDAKYCFVVSSHTPTAYKDKYGDDPASWPQEIQKAYYDWYTPDLVRVAEYYHRIEETEDRLTFEHVATGDKKKLWRSELAQGAIADMKVQGWRQMSRKPVKRSRIQKLTLSANGEIAPRQRIAGTEIPVVPVYGKRSIVDNMERFHGHIRFRKDAQRIYNAQLAKLVETSAVSPIERPIFSSEQMMGHSDEWANANLNRSPYSLINGIELNDGSGGKTLMGPLGTVSPPTVAPATAALLQLAAGDIAELGGDNDNSEVTKSNVSAEAMDIAATRTDAKAFTYLDNFRQSMQRCGEIYYSMAKEVYVEEGREVPTMDLDGQHDTATLVDQRMTPDGGVFPANDYANTKLNVFADVTETTATRRDKTVRTMLSGAQAVGAFDPELATVLASVALLNTDGEGMDDVSDWLRKKLVAQGVLKPTDDEKKALLAQQQQQQQQQPDPRALVLAAQTEKEKALTVKAGADAELSKAQAAKYLTEAHATHRETQLSTVQAAGDAATAGVEAKQRAELHQVNLLQRLGKFFGGQARDAA